MGKSKDHQLRLFLSSCLLCFALSPCLSCFVSVCLVLSLPCFIFLSVLFCLCLPGLSYFVHPSVSPGHTCLPCLHISSTCLPCLHISSTCLPCLHVSSTCLSCLHMLSTCLSCQHVLSCNGADPDSDHLYSVAVTCYFSCCQCCSTDLHALLCCSCIALCVLYIL